MILHKVLYVVNLKTDNFYNKLFALVLLALLISQNTFAQDPENTIFLTEEEQAWIAGHPVIRASNNTALAPFDFRSAGEAVGLSIDYLNLIGTKVGLKIDYLNFDTWSELLERAKKKEIDILHTISKNEERAKYFNFSAPYYNMSIVHFGRVGSQRINGISDLEDKRIGILRGRKVGEIYKKNYPHLNLVEFNTHSEILRALELGKIDVYTGGAAAIEFSISQNNILGIEIIGDDTLMLNHTMDQRIAVHKDNPILMAIINKGIAAVSDEEFKIISDKWIKPLPINYDIGLTKEELNWLSKNNVIKVAAERERFPYEFIDQQGKISGIAGDYLNEISKRLNIKFVWAGNESWNDGLLKVKSHEIEIVSTITPTKSREKLFKFTEVYFSFEQAIFAVKGGNLFPTLKSLAGYRLALVKGAVQIEYLKKNHPDIKIIEAKNTEEVLRLLDAGKVDATIADIQRINNLTLKLHIKDIIVTGIFPYKIENAMGIRSDLTFLVSSVRKALADIDPIRRQEILNKWQFTKIETAVDYTLVWYVIGFSLLMGIIFLIWNYSLRREINKRIKIEKRWRTILDNSSSGIFVIDTKGKISIVNKAAEKMFGYGRDELFGRNISILMNKAEQANHDTYLKNYLRTGYSKIIGSGRDLFGKHKNGNEFPIHLGIGEINDAFDGKAFIGSITDITETKQKEIQLKDAIETKSKFLASMSHDLRTPLNAIIGFSEIIKEEIFGPIGNKKYADYNRDIHVSGKYLLQLVNDILDLSKLEAGKNKLKYETFDFYKLALECQSIVYKLAEDKDIDLCICVCEDSPSVYADRLALTQIMMNLMSNSIKFTPPSGNVTINAHVSDNKHIIQVIDTGCGISKENIRLITEPFVKATESPFVSHAEGAGLGLTIVKSLIDLHSGDLVIDSILDKGTTITVTLPLKAVPSDI